MLERIRRMVFRIAIYIRLSKEDADKGYDESESITNQKALLTEYVKNLGEGYELYDIYIDPGYTGTNFNRPDFKRMITDIELGRVNMVITKDLSRLGRDYIETGEYVEKWFPEMNVRYISVTDGIDTFAKDNGNNDIAPFKAILNDMYSKDLSKKVRTALHTMQKQGKWVGSKAPLGYKKDPCDKNKLIINEDEVWIVKLIFEKALLGWGIGALRNYLEENNVPTANRLRYNEDSHWSTRAIKRILINRAYTGDTVQNKRSRISYKNRKLRPNPKEEWIIVENTHEPIIDKDIFFTVQKMKIAQEYTRIEKKNFFLLDGLLKCYECKHSIGVKKGRNEHWETICNYYRRTSKLHLCTSHGFNYCKLEKQIVEYVRKLFLDIDTNKIELSIKNSKNKHDYDKILKKLDSEIKTVFDNLDKMYMDKLNGKINDVMYERLQRKLQKEINEKEIQYKEIEKLKNNTGNDDIEKIRKTVKDFLKLENPTSDDMRVIINRIELHQDKQVDIFFNFKRLNDISDNCVHF